MAAHGPVACDVFVQNLQCFADEAFPDFVQRNALLAQPAVQRPHAVDRPEEIHGCRPCCRQRLADLVQLGIDVFVSGFQHADRNAHRRRAADRRCAANDHVLDRYRYFSVVPASHVGLFRRQLCLVDHHDAGRRPFDSLHHGLTSRRPTASAHPSLDEALWQRNDEQKQQPVVSGVDDRGGLGRTGMHPNDPERTADREQDAEWRQFPTVLRSVQ